MFNIGCAQEKKSGTVAVVAPAVTIDCARTACAPGTPGAPTGAGASIYSGSTVNLQNVATSDLQAMFYSSYPNNPTNIQLNVNFNRTDSIVISFVDGGKIVEAGLGIQFPDGSRKNNQFNGWVTEGSARNYKGFFQDKYGAVVIVIDQVLNTGDGSAAPLVGGSIWFQNFGDNPVYDSKCQSGQPAHYDQSTGRYVADTCQATQLMCWEITYGPYDCRSFLVAGGNYGTISLPSSPTPSTKGPTRTKSYVKLGTFTGLSRAAANIPAP